MPEGSSVPIMISIQALARVELGETGAPADQAPKAPETPTATHSQLAGPQGAASSTAPVRFAQVTLADQTTITGQFAYDPWTNSVIVLSKMDNGQETVDYVVATKVAKIEPRTTGVDGLEPIDRLTPPIQATLTGVNGAQMEGTLQMLSPAGYALLVPKGSTQAVTVPLQSLIRIHLVEAPTPAGEPTGAASTTPSSSGVPAAPQDSPYVTVPVGKTPATLTNLPKPGSAVTLETNLGQSFTGTIQSIQGDWVSLLVTSVASNALNPPRLTLVHRQNVLSVTAAPEAR